MSQLAEIKAAQQNLEECFSKRMTELEAQLHIGAPAKDTVAKVAEEFRAFRELMFSMLDLLRKQINECSAMVDDMETRHRRKALIFLGVPEVEKEDCMVAVLAVLTKLNLKDITASNISSCHRIGVQSKDHHRPILVRFSSVDIRSAVWRSKSRLKGSAVALKEFLTKTRQMIFVKARQHFGMRGCWTQDGVVVVKTVDGRRHKFTTADQLNILVLKYPKEPSIPALEGNSGAGTAASASNSRCRKQ